MFIVSLVYAKPLSEVEKYLEQHIADYDVIEFTPTKYADGFKEFVERRTNVC